MAIVGASKFEEAASSWERIFAKDFEQEAVLILTTKKI